MIATPQLWLPDRLRERREDERLMRGRGGLSRRWMPQNPCCCSGCLLFEDDFDREDIGDDWEVTSGDWSITDGKLASSDANAKICIAAAVQKIAKMQDSIVVTVQSIGSTGQYPIQRIHTGDSDFVDIKWWDYAGNSLVSVSINGGSYSGWRNTSGGTTAVTICHKPNAIAVLVDGDFARAGFAAGAPGTVCLGYSSPTGSLSYGSVRVEHGASVRSTCPSCMICANCPDPPPEDIEVTISGVVLNPGTWHPVHDCLNPSLEDYVNDTFILTAREPCLYCFGCVVPTQCRETEEDEYVDVYLLLRFQFYKAEGGKVGYWFRGSSGYNVPGSGCATEGNCYISGSTDTCVCRWGEYHGLREAPADNGAANTCLPNAYQFAGGYHKCCPSLLDWSNATVQVSAA